MNKLLDIRNGVATGPSAADLLDTLRALAPRLEAAQGLEAAGQPLPADLRLEVDMGLCNLEDLLTLRNAARLHNRYHRTPADVDAELALLDESLAEMGWTEVDDLEATVERHLRRHELN